MNKNPTPPPSTTWTFSTLGCPDLSLENVCAFARDWNIGTLELRCLSNRFDLPTLFEEAYGTPARLAAALAEQRMQVQILDTSLTLIQPTPEAKAECLRFAPWAEALGTRWLRVFDGGAHGQAPNAVELAEIAETLHWWRGERRRAGWSVDLVMETHTACVTQAACLDIQRQLDEPLAILWDSHHTWRAGEPIVETWNALAPYVRHVHVKDSVPDSTSSNGYRYVVPGTGEFPWQELQSAWRQQPYEGAVSLEWERKWHPELPPLEAALEAARQAGWF